MAEPVTRSVEMPALDLRAEFKPATLDADKRTVSMTWTTGAPVLRGFFDRYFEELSLDPQHVRMERLQSGRAPLLNSHNSDSIADVIGVVENARLDPGGKTGSATVRFDSGPAGDDAFRKVKDGILGNVSVGYRVHKLEKVGDRKRGSSDEEIPTFRAVDWEPYELSMVPIGADAGAGTRAAGTTNPCVFVTQQERQMADENKTTPAQPVAAGESAAVVATRDARLLAIESAKQQAEALAIAREKAIADERLRSAEIRELSRRSSLLGELWATRLIEAGTTVEEAQKIALRVITEDSTKTEIDGHGGVRFSAGDDARDKFIRGASAWMFVRSGMRPLLEKAKEAEPAMFADVSFDPGEFRGLTPVDLARVSLERSGVNTKGMDRLKLVGEAFTRSSNYQATGDFPILLENVLGKVLLGAYMTQENTWKRFCKVDQVPDFRTSNRYRTGSLPGLDILAEHQEYKSGVIPDGSKYPLTTQRMGKMFALSRETIVNDDMSALVDMATKLGAAAQRSIETSVYALIALNSGLGPTQGDSQPFFHSNRTNVNATGSAISMAGLDADRVILRAQKDPNAQDFLDLSPAVLLIPDSLRGQALQINNSVNDPTANKLNIPNIVNGLFRDVVGTPRLTGTRRYLIADPLDWIVVAFLEGYPGPIMEAQQGWRIDGVEWKVTLYAKAQMGDPKMAMTNIGQ
jgi:hypothetical protein